MVFFAILAVLLAALAGGRYLLFAHAERAEAALFAAGVPRIPEELAALYPPVPEDENAATLYKNAQNLIRDAEAPPDLLPVAGKEPLPARNEPWPGGLLALASAHLDANAEALALLHQAAERPRCRFNVDLTPSLQLQLGHLTHLPTAAALLELEAVTAAENGDSQRACDAIVACAAIARALTAEPLARSQITRGVCLRKAAEALEQALGRVAFTGEQLDAIQQAFAALDAPDALEKAWRAELALTCRHIRAASGLLSRILGLSELDRRAFAEHGAAILNAAAMGLPEALDAVSAARLTLLQTTSALTPITGAVLPALSKGFEENAVALASARAAQTAAAIERYRLAHGQLPNALPALLPEFLSQAPEDPFQKSALTYRVRPTGYVVYSVGPNRIDDRGEVRTPGSAKGDIPLLVERVPNRQP